MTTFAEIEKVNEDVNSIVRPVFDIEKYKVEDWWQDATERQNEGDCEDYAIAKVRRLIALGFVPLDEVRIALCWVNHPKDYHAVCVAKCDGVWFVLDNLATRVTEFSNVQYTWDIWGLGTQWFKLETTEKKSA